MAEAHTVTVVVIMVAEAVEAITTTIIVEEEVMVETMASKGKSKNFPLFRPEIVVATAVSRDYCMLSYSVEHLFHCLNHMLTQKHEDFEA